MNASQNPPLAISHWLDTQRAPEMLVAWQRQQQWTLAHLRTDVVALLARLHQHNAQRWALCFENSYLFIVALLATLHAGKIPVIPGHHRIALLGEQRSLFDGILSDQALVSQFAHKRPAPPSFEYQPVEPQSLAQVNECPVILLPFASDTSLVDAAQQALPAIESQQTIELFTSGSTGQPKRVCKTIACLDAEVCQLASHFANRLQGCRVIASVAPQHQYGLTFRVILPMALGLPLHAVTLYYVEQLTALDVSHRYIFVSSPAFLKRLDQRLTPPPVALLLCAGGVLPWRDTLNIQQWLQVTPHEIYGSTETGILGWREAWQPDTGWTSFPAVQFSSISQNLYVRAPWISQRDGLLLDDILQFNASGDFLLMGRRGRVVKIEEKRVSLCDVERRLLALDGVQDAAALLIERGNRMVIAALLVLDADTYKIWQQSPGKDYEFAWRCQLLPWLEPVAIPRYWRVVSAIPCDSMNKRNQAQLQEIFYDAS